MITEIGAVLEADRAGHRPGAPLGAGRRAGDEHRGLFQRLRRDDQRRLGRGLGLPALGQAVRHRLGRPRTRSSCWWTCRRPGPRTCCARTWRIWPSVCDDLLGADPLAVVRIETKIYYLGDFPDENYAEGFLSAARAVIDRPGSSEAGRLPWTPAARADTRAPYAERPLDPASGDSEPAVDHGQELRDVRQRVPVDGGHTRPLRSGCWSRRRRARAEDPRPSRAGCGRRPDARSRAEVDQGCRSPPGG